MHTMETNRLLLRRWHEADAEALYRYASDPAVGPAAGWPPHRSVAESRELIGSVLAGPEIYAIVLKTTGEPVGCIGLQPATATAGPDAPGEDEMELGYWLGRPHWGRGLTTEAARLLLARCFGELGMKTVWGVHYEGNAASRRVMEKCGFAFHHTERAKPTPLGDVRTEHFMRLTAEAWAARNGRGR